MGTYHHGDLRATLVAHGITMLERDGLERLSLRAVAREAGVSHAAPARHFADAAAFLAAIAAAGYRELGGRLAAATGTTEQEALLAVGRAYVSFALSHPQWYQVTFHPSRAAAAGRDEELHAASDAAFEVLRDRVAAAVAAGVMDQRDESELALTMWSTVHGICSLLLDRQLTAKGFVADPVLVADSVLANLYLGLRPTG